MESSTKFSPSDFLHVCNEQRPQLLESYCSLCGMFVATSLYPLAVEMEEQIHVCPKFLSFRLPGNSC